MNNNNCPEPGHITDCIPVEPNPPTPFWPNPSRPTIDQINRDWSEEVIDQNLQPDTDAKANAGHDFLSEIREIRDDVSYDVDTEQFYEDET